MNKENIFIKQSGYVADFETNGDILVAASHVKFFQCVQYAYNKSITLPGNISWYKNDPSFIYEGDIMEQLLDSLAKDPADTIFIYYHNLKNFDGHFIVPWLIEQRFKHSIELDPHPDHFNTVEVLNKILCIKLNYKNKRMVFLDSASQLPMSLDTAAKLFAPESLKLNPQQLLAEIGLFFNSEYEANKVFYATNPLQAYRDNQPLFMRYKSYTKQDVRALADVLSNYMKGSNLYLPKSITASSMAIMTLGDQEPDQLAKMQLDFTEDNLK